MNEVSLREYLAELGWGFEYLGHGGDIARVGQIQGASCYEPFGMIRRTLSEKRLLIHQVLPPGTTIKFLSSLRFDVLQNPGLWDCMRHPLVGILMLVGFIVTKLSGKSVSDLQNMPQMQGYVETFPNPPYFEFPFDQPLTVKAINMYAISLSGENGVEWTLPTTSLATVKQITVVRP